jgi:hypothetical protein
MTATLRATRIKEENVVGFHVQPHYISQQPAFVMLLLATFILVWSNIEGKRGENDVYRHICFDDYSFLKQTLHKSKSSRSRSLHLSTISYSKNNNNISDTGAVHILGWKSGEVYEFGSDRRWSCPNHWTSIWQLPLSDPDPDPAQLSSPDASSTCHLMMETDPVLIMCSFVVSIHSTMHKSRNQHSIWRLHSISVRIKWEVTQPICSIKYNNKKCKTITEILRKTLHEVTVFTLSTFVSQCNIHTYMQELYPACSPVGTDGDVKSTCLISAQKWS